MSKSQDRKRTRMFDKKAKRGDAQKPILKVWPQEPWGENLDDEFDPSQFELDAKPASEPQPMSVDKPDWLEGYLKYQSDFTRMLGDQILEDHQILIDHDWRLRDIEEYLGMAGSAESKPEPEPQAKAEPKPAPEPQAKAEPKPAPQSEPKPEPKSEPKSQQKAQPEPKPAPQSEPKAQPEPQPQSKAQPEPKPEPQQKVQPEPKVKAKAKAQPQPQQKAQPEPQPQVGLRQGLAPREMYEAECFDGGKWRLCGPFKRISQAEQITMGDLNRVNIVWLWWDYKKDIPCGYLTADDMLRYL